MSKCGICGVAEMTTTEIVITDADQARDYRLTVAYAFRPGHRPKAGWGAAGDPGAAPAVEINSVRCTEVLTWCGKIAVSATPGLDPAGSTEETIGAWCAGRFAAEIETAVLEGHQA